MVTFCYTGLAFFYTGIAFSYTGIAFCYACIAFSRALVAMALISRVLRPRLGVRAKYFEFKALGRMILCFKGFGT